ncbi:MAG TPA: IS110 family transposase [Ktedonobacterales bacterium]|nr:IS110 family transposase [Ktedonobacterales bacterium]
MWYAGLDWSDTHHDVVVIDADGRHLASKRVAHTKAGLETLVQFLEGISGSALKEQMACIIETTHGLLIAALLEAGLPVYPVNPKTLDRRRVPSGAKTDLIDAYLLAKTGRADLADLRRLQPDSALVQELKTLTRDQDALIQMQTRLVNQLTACLKAYYPVALSLFGKLHQRSTVRFLQAYPTPQEAIDASQAHLTSVLKQAGHSKAEQVAAKLFERLHQPQLVADPITTRTKSRLMLALVAQLLPLLEQIAAYDEEITALFLTHADSPVFASLPGAGKRLAPRLLAEWGDDRVRYTSARKVQALAGTAPVPYESGNYRTAHRRSACLKPLRNALYQFAWQSTLCEPWAKDYYHRKRAQGKSHSVAVRALSNTWVRIVFRMWVDQQGYARGIFEAAQGAHAPLAA